MISKIKDFLRTHVPAMTKSFTAWFGTLLAFAPIWVPMLQQNFDSLRPLIPDALENHIMYWVGAIVVILRMKTSIQAAKKGA